MTKAKLGLTNFQNVVLGTAGVVAFIAKAAQKKPSFLEVLSFAGELTPFTQVSWSDVVPEGLDMDAEESAPLKDALALKFQGLANGKIKEISVKVVEAVEPGVKFYNKVVEIIELVKSKPAAEEEATAVKADAAVAPASPKAKKV